MLDGPAVGLTSRGIIPAETQVLTPGMVDFRDYWKVGRLSLRAAPGGFRRKKAGVRSGRVRGSDPVAERIHTDRQFWFSRGQ